MSEKAKNNFEPLNFKVKNHIDRNAVNPITRIYTQEVKGVSSLGSEVKISPKTAVMINSEGFNINFLSESVSAVVKIGESHTAELIMSVDAWNALLEGFEVSTDTKKDFMDKYIIKPNLKK